LTPEEESDALLDALAAGELPDSRDPAARVLAVLRGDVVDQWRSSVSMTPST
jgi:DNA-directed RNA polymerase subunit H (RpoH/RPB5)